MHQAEEVLLDQLREMTPAEMLENQAEAEGERDRAEIELQQARNRLEADLGLNGSASADTLEDLDNGRREVHYWTTRYWMLRAARVNR